MAGPKESQIKAINWQDPSKFKIDLTGTGAGLLGLPDADTLTMCCTSVGLAEVNSSPVEDWVGEEWRFAIGRLEQYNISITFKDYNNFTLYKKFAKGMQDFSRKYPDDQKFNVEIYTTDSFQISSFVKAVDFKDCLLVSVSGAALDNSAVATVAEFTVTMKCTHVTTY